MGKGTTLFGWCLPDMDITQHEQCIHTLPSSSDIVCPCQCHTDFDEFKKQLNKPVRKKKGNK